EWKKDLIYCIDKLGMKGIELYPYYHDYKLIDDSAVELINFAADRSIPVHLPCAIENIRQRHWMDATENLSIDDVEKVLRLCPDANFIISNGPTHIYADRLKELSDIRKGKVYYDFARVEVFLTDFDALVEAAGIENIVFGSAAPFQYMDPQLVKLEYAKLDSKKIDKIKYKNIEKLLGL